MGLLDFFFRRKDAEEEGIGAQGERPRYGQLAEDENLAEELRTRNIQAERTEEAQAGKTPPRLWGFERTAGQLSERVQRERLTRWPKITKKLGKLESRLAGAESSEDVRKIAKQALSPRGLFRKIERGMEKRLTGLEEAGASRGEIRRYERDLRKLERRLKRPTRFLR